MASALLPLLPGLHLGEKALRLRCRLGRSTATDELDAAIGVARACILKLSGLRSALVSDVSARFKACRYAAKTSQFLL